MKVKCYFLWGAALGECDVRLARTLYFTIENVLGARKVTSLARRVAVCVFMVGSWSDHARIMVGSFSDRPRIGNDVSSVFKDFVRNFAIQFCVAGAVFGEVGS